MPNSAMIDTIKAVFTYATAAVIAVGGLFSLVLYPQMPPDTKTIVGALVGSSLTFLFNQEVQTRTARQAAAQTLASATASTTPTNGDAH